MPGKFRLIIREWVERASIKTGTGSSGATRSSSSKTQGRKGEGRQTAFPPPPPPSLLLSPQFFLRPTINPWVCEDTRTSTGRLFGRSLLRSSEMCRLAATGQADALTQTNKQKMSKSHKRPTQRCGHASERLPSSIMCTVPERSLTEDDTADYTFTPKFKKYILPTFQREV